MVKLLPAPAREGLSDLEASQFTTDIFSRKLGTAGEKISENLSTLLSESASGFVPMLCPFTLQRTKICRLLSIAVRKNSSVLAAGAGFSSGDFQNLARR